METKKVSKELLKRLPLYLNYTKTLPESTANISATKMAIALGLGDVQVRKDLAKISDGGRRRIGHSREKLIRDMENFLDLDSATNAVLVGVGKMGKVLLDDEDLALSGLNILAGFDKRPSADLSEGGKPIYSVSFLEEFCRSHDVQVGIIAVPAECAQDVCGRLIACGVKAVWNFAPTYLQVPAHITVQNENLTASLTTLRMRLKYSDSAEAI